MSLPHPDAKRKMVRDGFVRDHAELILQYDKLLQIIPDPCVPSSKRTWERQMYHVRAVARHVQECHETGNRASLHNYLLSKFEKLFADKVEYRFMVPDPADEWTDAAWINETLSALIVLQGSN